MFWFWWKTWCYQHFVRCQSADKMHCGFLTSAELRQAGFAVLETLFLSDLSALSLHVIWLYNRHHTPWISLPSSIYLTNHVSPTTNTLSHTHTHPHTSTHCRSLQYDMTWYDMCLSWSANLPHCLETQSPNIGVCLGPFIILPLGYVWYHLILMLERAKERLQQVETRFTRCKVM